MERTRRNSRTRNLFIFLGRFFRVALEAELTIGRFIRPPPRARARVSNDERDFDSSHATWANSLHHTVHAEKRNGCTGGRGEEGGRTTYTPDVAISGSGMEDGTEEYSEEEEEEMMKCLRNVKVEELGNILDRYYVRKYFFHSSARNFYSSFSFFISKI